MRRTILSENQYDPRFMTAAKTNAIMRPFEPPATSPMTSNSPLRSPSSSAVFTPFAMIVDSILTRRAGEPNRPETRPAKEDRRRRRARGSRAHHHLAVLARQE